VVPNNVAYQSAMARCTASGETGAQTGK